MTAKLKPTPKAVTIVILRRYALEAMRLAGISDNRALHVVNLLNAKGRELADEIIKELGKENV